MPNTSGPDVLQEPPNLVYWSHLPVIILTKKGQNADRRQALSLGVDAFLTKPFSLKKLLNQVNAFLARH